MIASTQLEFYTYLAKLILVPLAITAFSVVLFSIIYIAVILFPYAGSREKS